MTMVTLAALLLQLTVFVDVRIGGVAPELMVLVAVLAGILAGAARGSVIAFFVGLAWDLYLATPLGLSAVSFALAAYAVGGFEKTLFSDSRIQAAALTGLATAGAVAAYAVLGELVGQRDLIDGDLVSVVVIASVVNTVLAPGVAPLVRWAVTPFRSAKVRSADG